MAEMAQKSHWSLDFARWWLTERPGLKRTFQDLKDREEQISRGVLMCPGCGAEAGLRIGLRAIGDGIVLATPGGCLSATMGVGVDSNIKVCSILPILSGAASLATGIKRGLTAPEAGALLELPLNKVLMLVLFGMLQFRDVNNKYFHFFPPFICLMIISF